jgi:sulfate adenylyltransferase subunit 2
MQELKRAREIIDDVSKETDSILLFHSLSGKDSIVLLDLCYNKFKRVVVVFMYLVKDLEHVMRYYNYAKAKYPNIEFVQVPHYALFNYIKTGYMGIKQNTKQRQWTLADITEKLREKIGVEWACYGFKQSDSLNRRLMLRSYTDGKEAINWKTKKFYPLSTYKNKEIMDFILDHRLKNPEVCGTNKQSSGVDIEDIEYQKYLKELYPSDLEKIYKVFPMARIVMLKANSNKEELK